MHIAQLMPLPLTVSCFTKIQIGFTFLVPAHPGSPGKRAVKRVCVCVCPVDGAGCIMFSGCPSVCAYVSTCVRARDGLLHPHLRHCSSAASAVRQASCSYRDIGVPCSVVGPFLQPARRPATRYQTTGEIRHVPVTVVVGT